MKICVLSVFGIGNAIDKIPMLMLLQDSHCYVTVIQDVAGRGVFEDAYFIHNLEYYNPVEHKFETDHLDIEYDYCISATPSNGWMKNLINYKKLIGSFDDFRDWSTPDWKYNLILCSELFGNDPINLYDKIPDIYFPLKKEVVQEFDYIGVHTGGSITWPWKRMNTDFWKALHYQVKKVLNKKLLFFGTYSDFNSGSVGNNLHDWFMTDMETSRMLCDSMSLKETATLIKKYCSSFISNDSGLMHLSASLGIPTIGLFGPTSSIKNSPFSRNFISYSNVQPCSPCQMDWDKMVRCPFDRKCLYPDIEKIMELLIKKIKKY